MDRAQRLFAPLVLFGAAGYCTWVNLGDERRIVFPFFDRISTDPHTQGLLTVGILAILGCVATFLAMRTPRE